jgi:hypothetical protein
MIELFSILNELFAYENPNLAKLAPTKKIEG